MGSLLLSRRSMTPLGISLCLCRVGKGEKESALESAVWALFCCFPHWNMWKVKFDCIFKDTKGHDSVHCWMLSNVLSHCDKKGRLFGKYMNLLSQAHIQKYLPKPIFWPFGFSITARTQPAKV